MIKHLKPIFSNLAINHGGIPHALAYPKITKERVVRIPINKLKTQHKNADLSIIVCAFEVHFRAPPQMIFINACDFIYMDHLLNEIQTESFCDRSF